MQSSRSFKRHADLVDLMATAQGVDLEEARMAGHLTPGALAEAVLACTGCAAPGACEHWLDTHEAGERAPAYCRNADLLADLTARLGR